ncbi:hypothetical protein SRHO_G00257090 [Serrasalmus rhombeus]
MRILTTSTEFRRKSDLHTDLHFLPALVTPQTVRHQNCGTVNAQWICSKEQHIQERINRSVMQSCSSALILLISTFTLVSGSADSSVKVKLHDSATLPCSERCSGLARWTVSSKPSDTLAECNQTLCRSVKEGYQMIYDQYLKGDLSLIITEADYSKTGTYTCDCDGKDLCDVQLQVEPFRTLVQIKPGDPLVLHWNISDSVKVIYKNTSTAGPSSGQICTVKGLFLHCKLEYERRASLTSALELRGMKTSESGVYTVVESESQEVIHIYTVTVESAGGSEKIKDDQPDVDTDRGAAVPVWVTVQIVLLVVLVAVILGLVIVIVRLRRKTQQLRMNNERNSFRMNNLSNNSPEEERLSAASPPSDDQ